MQIPRLTAGDYCLMWAMQSLKQVLAKGGITEYILSYAGS